MARRRKCGCSVCSAANGLIARNAIDKPRIEGPARDTVQGADQDLSSDTANVSFPSSAYDLPIPEVTDDVAIYNSPFSACDMPIPEASDVVD